ncbi:hypothetical protein M0802_009365 [Mischocyttarus mexicanus]|nr:hypothetical protein M0802_009365 [Mischocyttarus mexicanus]
MRNNDVGVSQSKSPALLMPSPFSSSLCSLGWWFVVVSITVRLSVCPSVCPQESFALLFVPLTEITGYYWWYIASSWEDKADPGLRYLFHLKARSYHRRVFLWGVEKIMGNLMDISFWYGTEFDGRVGAGEKGGCGSLREGIVTHQRGSTPLGTEKLHDEAQISASTSFYESDATVAE